MKLTLLLALLPSLALAQGAVPSIAMSTDPPATCGALGQMWFNYISGQRWYCNTVNAWVLIPGSGAAWDDVTGKPAAVTSLTGTNTGDQTAISGNAGTATALQNARTINGVSFNGTANITVPAAGSTLSDNVPTSKLNSGTNASASTYWRGDAVWATPSGGGGPLIVRKAADQASTSTTFADVTGMTFSIAAGTSYRIECDLSYLSAATTTALQISLNGPASPTAVRFTVRTSTSATAMHSASQNVYEANTNPASALTTALPVRLVGVVENGVNAGTLALRMRTEVSASSVTIQRGSSCVLF